MSYSQALKTYPVPLASMSEDVPASLGSDTRARPIPSSVRTVAIASTSGAQNPGGYTTFYIPSGSAAGLVKPYSMYCQFDVVVSGITALSTVKFNGPMASASACVDRLTLSANNQVIEQINNYNVYHDLLMAMTTSNNFYATDSAILEHSGITDTLVGAATSITYKVVIPVLASTFNQPKAFPLFLLNQALQLQLDWSIVNNAIAVGAGTNTTYQIQNAYLVYDQINVDEQYKMSLRQAMMDPANPKLYQLNITNVFGSNISYSASQGVALNLGVNYSSLRGVIYTNIVDPANFTTDRDFTQANTNNAKLILDGTAVNNFALSSTAIQFAEANKVFNNLWDSNATFALGAAFYTTDAYCGGISCTKFNDGSCSFVGTPCQNLELSITASANTPANNKLYYFLLADMAVAIDATGNITMIR